jgi:hypothetical protein
MWTNMDERQHPRQEPQGTPAAPFPDGKEDSVVRSHAENPPAEMATSPEERSPLVSSLLVIRNGLPCYKEGT